MSLSTPCGAPRCLAKGRLLSDPVCAVPYGGQLLLYVLVQTVLTALWGVLSVALERIVQRWRTRPRPWHATRSRARTRYDSEKDEVFFQTQRGAVAGPGVPLEHFATYTSDLDPDLDNVQPLPANVQADDELDMEGARTPLPIALLSTVTSVKFGLSLRAAIAALPCAVQLGIGLHLRTRDGVPCPAAPRAAGWFGLVGSQATLPTQVVVSLLALKPSRALAPGAALLAAALQTVWNGTLLVSLASFSSGQCMARDPVGALGAGRIAAAVLIEVLTACAATMFAMHVRPRPRAECYIPVSVLGLSILAAVLVALQFARAAVVAAVFPPGADLPGALRCAVDETAQGTVYAFGRFVGLF
ncbi:hypothetical protein AURDEDRAFT_150002 [Auricularia subglabra TFB-10046 SS5]|nr:hypothetical protein AURDEDRAFT_150002 [Auricularia subglabra TFB-10046 SS5]